MAAANFERALKLVLLHEGGYSDHPADPGGATNLGVTIGTLSQVLGRPATKAEVRALTREAVAPIYRANYWNAVHGDLLPAGVDYAVFDFAVNSGRGRAIPSLQRAIGVADDGLIGPITLANAAAMPVLQTIERICADRMTFLRRLTTWKTFGKGWTARVEGVSAEALAMAKIAVPTVSVEVSPLPATVAPPPPPRPLPPVTSIAQPNFLARIFDRLRAAYPRKD